MQKLIKMKLIALIFTFFICYFGNAQTEITLKRNPYSDQNHKLTLLREGSQEANGDYYDIKSKKRIEHYKSVKISIVDFKSLIIDKNSLTIKLDADGILALDKISSDYIDGTLAFVFNDTIYQTKKIKEPIYNGLFKIENISKKQQNNIVNYYKSLPSYDLQKELYSAISSGKLKKIDSLLDKGAQLVDGGYKVGPNNFKHVIYDVFKNKNSEYEKYPNTVAFLLKRGFVPNPKNIYQAIAFEDEVYVKKFFLKEKNMANRQKLLRKHVREILEKGSLDLLLLVEDLGLNLEQVKFGKHNLLRKAILVANDEMIGYLLTKDIPFEKASLMTYAAIYNKIETLDVILQSGVDINSLYTDKSNIAQGIIEIEFSDDYFMGNISLKKIPLLIERHLNVNNTDNKNETVLHAISYNLKHYLTFRSGVYAIYDPSKIAKEITTLVSLLKSKGIDTSIKDNKGFTAYDYALKDAEIYKIEPEELKELLAAFK